MKFEFKMTVRGNTEREIFDAIVMAAKDLWELELTPGSKHLLYDASITEKNAAATSVKSLGMGYSWRMSKQTGKATAPSAARTKRSPKRALKQSL